MHSLTSLIPPPARPHHKQALGIRAVEHPQLCGGFALHQLSLTWPQQGASSTHAGSKAMASPRAALHRDYMAAEGLWQRTFLLGWSFLLLQNFLHQPAAPKPTQILHSASPMASEQKPPQHQLPPQTPGYHQPGPPALNSYLNRHFKPTTALPPPNQGCRCYTITSLPEHHQLWSQGANPTLSPEDMQDSGEHLTDRKNRGQVKIQGATQRIVSALQRGDGLFYHNNSNIPWSSVYSMHLIYKVWDSGFPKL